MMYNRYVPTANGGYQRQIMQAEPKQTPAKECAPSTPEPSVTGAQTPSLPKRSIALESEDLLVLMILALVLINNTDCDSLPMLITIAAFILLQ